MGEGSALATTMSFTDQPLKQLRVSKNLTRRNNVQTIAESFLPTNAEVAEDFASTHRKNSAVRRKMIRDLCDYCLEKIWVFRNQLNLRLRGKKFSCPKCYGEKDGPKADRAIPGKFQVFK